MNHFAPIVLFVYNRPWHTRQTLEALEKNDFADKSELIVFADGPKPNATQEEYTKIKEVREIIKEKNWCKTVNIIESDINKGLADSIIYGVTKVVNEYGKIIVLEDDIVTSKGFLKYMNDALSFYKQEEKVMQISGYQQPCFHNNKNIIEVFLHRRTTSWGWATWDRSWNKFITDTSFLINQFKKRDIISFNINNCTDRYSMLINQKKRIIDSWAIRWAATVYLNNGLVLWPSFSLIKNIGLDGSGIHCQKTNSIEDNLLFNDSVISFKFPEKIKENKDYLLKLEKYYKNYNHLTITKKIKFWLNHFYYTLIT